MIVFGRTMTRAEYKRNDGEYRRRENEERDEGNQRAGGMRPRNFDLLGRTRPWQRLRWLRLAANAFVPSYFFHDNKSVPLPKDLAP